MGKPQTTATYRHQAYQLFAILAMKPMDEALFNWILSEEAETTLGNLRNWAKESTSHEGFSLMLHAVKALRETPPEEQKTALNALATDRTYLFRALAPGVGALPPYESYWAATTDAESIILQLKKDYRQGGLEMSDLVHDRPDYLGVELTYLATLTAGEEDSAIQELQTDFIGHHIGSWLPKYLESAKAQVSTEFYKGYLLALGLFIAQEKVSFAA